MQAISTDAFVLVDKPAGITSFDAVRAVGRALGTRRVGHTGTLDPFATGLLVMLAGRGTRLMRYVPGEPKVYRAEIVFGSETDTHDLTGSVIREAALPDEEQVRRVIERLTGSIEQLPPEYSARKVQGKRAYELARRGETPDLAPTPVVVHSWEVLTLEPTRLVARITCGGGTYIRALARDLGRLTDSAAHVATLRRERCGPFDIADAVSWDEVSAGRVVTRGLRVALLAMPTLLLDEEGARRVKHGMTVPAQGEGTHSALLGPDDDLLGVARREGDRWQPETILPNA